MLYVAVTRAQKSLRLNSTLTDILSITNAMENIYKEVPTPEFSLQLKEERCFHCFAGVKRDASEASFRVEQIGQPPVEASKEVRYTCSK